MITLIYIKTNRAKCGYAKAELHKFITIKNDKKVWCYSFQFYSTHKFFNRYNDLKDYLLNNYEFMDQWWLLEKGITTRDLIENNIFNRG